MNNDVIKSAAKQIAKNARACHLLKSIENGQPRIFFVSECPPGWTLLERLGVARRVAGTDRAELTEDGVLIVATELML